MSVDRIKAFSDGVLAIIITVMCLELKAPQGDSFADLAGQWPTLLAYVLSFLYVGIYWNNHHHLFYAVEKVNGAVLWANTHFLFWLSLLPFANAWASTTLFATGPVAFYGCVLTGAAVSYYLLVIVLLRAQGRETVLHRAIGDDFKGKVSIVLYLVGIAGTFWRPWVGGLFYLLVAAVWLVPDQRIEREMGELRSRRRPATFIRKGRSDAHGER